MPLPACARFGRPGWGTVPKPLTHHGFRPCTRVQHGHPEPSQVPRDDEPQENEPREPSDSSEVESWKQEVRRRRAAFERKRARLQAQAEAQDEATDPRYRPTPRLDGDEEPGDEDSPPELLTPPHLFAQRLVVVQSNTVMSRPSLCERIPARYPRLSRGGTWTNTSSLPIGTDIICSD